MQCCGSVPFLYGTGSGPLTNGSGSCYIRPGPSKRQQKHTDPDPQHWGAGDYRAAANMSERDDRSSYSAPNVTFDSQKERFAFPEPEFVNLSRSSGLPAWWVGAITLFEGTGDCRLQTEPVFVNG